MRFSEMIVRGIFWGMMLIHGFVLIMVLENHVTYGGDERLIWYVLFNMCMCALGIGQNPAEWYPDDDPDDTEEE